MSKIKVQLVSQARRFARSEAGRIALIPVQFLAGLSVPVLLISIFLVTLTPQLASSSYSKLATRITTDGGALALFLSVWLALTILVAGFLQTLGKYWDREPVKSTRPALYVGILIGFGFTSIFAMAQLLTFRVLLAFSLSFATISTVFILAASILAEKKAMGAGVTGFRSVIRSVRPSALADVLRDDSWYPSLALFQFLMWTVVVAFAYLGIFLLRVSAGATNPYPTFPTNLLEIMGISVGVPIVNSVVSKKVYKENEPQSQVAGFSSILKEGDKASLTRFQMFAWTWIGVMVYLAIVFTKVADLNTLANVQNLSLPDVDSTLVLLMGLSQGGYLGGKLVSKTKPKPAAAPAPPTLPKPAGMAS